MIPKRIILAVSNDIIYDQRVHKVATTLQNHNADVLILGRMQKNSSPLIPQRYLSKRLSLIFNCGIFFYLELNIRLFFYLLFAKVDIIVANDVDTIIPCYMVAKLRRKQIIFDSHELLSESPMMDQKPSVQKVWQWVERCFIPRIDLSITVCDSIADVYRNIYDKDFVVIKNLPFQKQTVLAPPTPFVLPDHQPIILYQGSVNVGRGLENMLLAMKDISDAILVIIGDGDILPKIKKSAESLGLLNSKVFILGGIPHPYLPYYTRQASIGISIEELLGQNYEFALPNKIFDYINAGVPVVCSDFVEMKKIIETYNIGTTIKEKSPEAISQFFNEIFKNRDLIAKWKENTYFAASELCWENQEKSLLDVYQKAGLEVQ